MSNPDLGNIQIAEPRKLWKDEAGDFTLWLAEKAELQCDTIRFPIEICITEKETGNFNLHCNK